ncbi:MAG: Mini-ribonuclease 3 [Erysipelotrichaceae bacterium]|nr:Mini-ribonuclease 3 [Erysipelotrichaceae bacterium]
MEIMEIGSLSLAFVGDAHFSLLVRKHLVSTSHVRPQMLQKMSVKFVSAKAQARIMEHILDCQLLSETELDVYKRGRNAKSNTTPKNTDVQTYHISTGFEALWGYWVLTEQEERLTQMWDVVRTFVEG